MPGIDQGTISPHLNINPNFPLVKQKKKKKKNIILEKKVSCEEVDKLPTMGFIKEVKYPNWLANLILVKKQNSK